MEASPRTETTLGNSMSQQNLLGSSFGSQQSYGSSLLDSSLHGRERRYSLANQQDVLLWRVVHPYLPGRIHVCSRVLLASSAHPYDNQ